MPQPPRQRQMERQQAGAGNERAVARRRWLRYLLARSKDGLLAGILCRKLRGFEINPDPQHQA